LGATALLLVPGLGVVWFSGIRGASMLGASLGISTGIAAVAAVIAPVLGLRWSLLPLLIVTVAVTAVAGLAAWAGRRHPAKIAPRSGIVPVMTIVVAAVAWTGIVAYGMGSPSHPPQHFDGIFHLNAIEFILDHGSASPFDMTMTTDGASTFYPTVWHAMTALIVPLSGGIVAANNVMSVAVIAVAWPAGMMFLTGAIWPRRRWAMSIAPLLTLAFGLYPLGFLNWGALYPNLLGNAIIPVAMAFAVLGTRRNGRPWWQQALLVLGLGATAGGMALAHPSALMTALALIVPLLVARAVQMWQEPDRSGAWKWGTTIAVAVYCIGLVAVWPRLNVTTHEWMPYESFAQGLGEGVFLGPIGRPSAILLVVLWAMGVVAVFRTRAGGRWLVGSQAIAIGFFLVAVWLPFLGVRSAVVGLWYDDVYRLGAVLILAALPMAALGFDEIVRALIVMWRRVPRRAALMATVATALVLAVCAAGNLLVVRYEVRAMRDVSFQFSDRSQGLSADEAELLEEVGDILPPDAVIAGDPLTGAGLVYAYTGRRALFPHIKGYYGDDAALIGEDLRDGGAEVCDALARLGVDYVLDFGDRLIFPGYQSLYEGMHDLAGSPLVTPVESVGDATLYEITGCG